MTTATLITTIKALPRAQFASFRYTAVSTNETALYTVILGSSTERLYARDVTILEHLSRHRGLLAPVMGEAVEAILSSRLVSLAGGIGHNPAYTLADTLESIGDGLSVHRETGELYISGLVRLKTGKPRKPVNSRPLTLAKRTIERRFLPSSRFRSFKLSNILTAKVRGNILELE